MRSMPLVLLLAACDFYPEADTGDTGPADACATILVPGILNTPSELAADAHEDSYGAAPAPFHVHLGLPTSDPSTSASFLWRTDLDTKASVLEYGEGDALDQRVEGGSFAFGGTNQTNGPYRVHEARLCSGLLPSTTYSYRVGGDGGWSPPYQFTTAPAPGSTGTIRVAIAGDSRGSYETWGTILTTMDSYDPDFILFSGDMVELGPDQSEWDAWFDASSDILARRLFLAAHGNHEFISHNYFAQFGFPDVEEWYSMRWGHITMVSLNDTVRDLNFLSTDEVAFMDERFAPATSDWRFAMHHQPIYSACTRHGSYESLREVWGPVFDRHDVHAVVAGHNHIYERSVFIKENAEVPPGDGTLYIVSGGAGAPLYEESDAEWFADIANPIEHYIIADIGETEATFTVRDLSDNVIDTFTLTK